MASELLVVIPAWNEARSIGDVIQTARAALNADVLVVDDGSTDNTQELALEAQAIVMTLPFNLGVGGAIRAGLRYASEKGYQCALQVDADGQHDIASAFALLAAIDDGADIAVGSRFAAGYHVPLLRSLIMRMLARFVSWRVGRRLTDTTSGFRALGRSAIEYLANNYPAEYLSDTVETLLLASDHGLSVIEVDVQMHERKFGQSSSSALRSTYHMARLLLSVSVHDLRTARQTHG